MSQMNPLDWLLALLLAYSITRAALRGFFREAFALGGLILGFLLACWNYKIAAAHLAGLISSPELAQMAGFLLILFAIMALATLAGRLFRRSARAIGLGIVDRILGGLFGLIRGVILGLALLLAFAAFLPASPWIQNSLLTPYFLRADHAVSFVMPSELKLRLMDNLQHLKHKTPDWIKSGISSHTEY
jgi:membrane protein required for colicin V production